MVQLRFCYPSSLLTFVENLKSLSCATYFDLCGTVDKHVSVSILSQRFCGEYIFSADNVFGIIQQIINVFVVDFAVRHKYSINFAVVDIDLASSGNMDTC